jgi:organic radical activating enzyme
MIFSDTTIQKLKMNFYKQVMNFYVIISAPFRFRPRKKLKFEIDIVANCNLNCKCCFHFSPLVNNNYVNPEELERDFKRLSELAGRKDGNIELMGGEPLLHPEINKIIEISRKYFDGNITIVTNGILLPKMNEEFWQSCKKNNINILVTSYPIKLDRKLIKKKAIFYSVKLKMRMQVMKVQTWCRLPKDIQGKQNIKNSFKNCIIANFCISLKNGKIATCCLPLVAERFNNFYDQKFIVEENDYIDIYSVKNVEEIYEFLSKPIPFCRYCKTRQPEYGIKWGISKKDIHEWID